MAAVPSVSGTAPPNNARGDLIVRRNQDVSSRRSTYLIQDPYDKDAVEFIRTIALHYGLRPVCFYTDPRGRFDGERMFPELRSPLIEATYDVDLEDRNGLESFAREVQDRYDIVGIVPFLEDKVETAADLLELLDLQWNDPTTLRRFRNKHEMKAYVASTAPHVRVPFTRLVTSADELSGGHLPEKFVVKPNDGLGNLHIGIFDRDSLEQAQRHISDNPGFEWVVEEFIDGTEYVVNGHVRADGTVDVLAVQEYVRGEVDGYSTIYLAHFHIHTDEEPFQELASYATELVTALGLRGCPFHLEAIIDDKGPAVVDLAARLPSEAAGWWMTRLHPYRPSTYLVAAHDYLGRDELDLDVRWDRYNSTRMMYVYGFSEMDTHISSLHGIDELEAFPEFVQWRIEPHVGQKLSVTRELLSAPYCVDVEGDWTREEAIEFSNKVRSIVRWNEGESATKRGEAKLRDAVPRAFKKGRWAAEQARRAAQRY